MVNFADGMKFEVVPGILLKDNAGYWYPDANNGGRWRTTNPFAEQQRMREVNTTTNGNLRELCRMTRAWRRHCGVEISGLLIDTLATSFIQTWAQRDKSYLYYDYLTRDFMLYLLGRDPKQQHWLAPGSGQHVFRTGKFETKASVAYQHALNAVTYDATHRTTARREAFREIYGNHYPR